MGIIFKLYDWRGQYLNWNGWIISFVIRAKSAQRPPYLESEICSQCYKELTSSARTHVEVTSAGEKNTNILPLGTVGREISLLETKALFE